MGTKCFTLRVNLRNGCQSGKVTFNHEVSQGFTPRVDKRTEKNTLSTNASFLENYLTNKSKALKYSRINLWECILHVGGKKGKTK